MIGRTVAHYKILEKLGEGGMGEVYRAEDTKLGRQVAIKVLPQAFTADPDRLARFEREARALAALDHPNIVHIYSVEETEGVHLLTMQLVEGERLAELIPEGGMPLDQFLELAIPLADGLRAAHEKGVTHRDLKPENVMIDQEGRSKILDFGLAKLRLPDSDAGASQLPTQTMTQAGMVMGTVPYMSPEQVQGEPVDHRTDLFSLGVILYEMITGHRPFSGKNSAALISSILRDTPAPVVEIRAGLPAQVDRILRRCVEKDPDRRFQSAGEVCDELRNLEQALPATRPAPVEAAPEPITAEKESVPAPAPRTGFDYRWLAVPAIIASAIISVYFAVPGLRRKAVENAPAQLRTSYEQVTSQPGPEQYPSLSPDSKWVVYSGEGTGNHDIYLQRVGGKNPINLTEDWPDDDRQPAFSPDGELIAFRSSREGGGLFVMEPTGEAVRRVTRRGFNPAWSPDGNRLVFADESVELKPLNWQGRSELWVADVTTADSHRISEGDAVQPNWSPGGHRIAYTARWKDPTQMDIRTMPAGGGESVAVTDDVATDWSPVWSPDGRHIYFASDRGGSMNLWRIPVDEESGEALGEPQPITTPATFLAHLSLSADGQSLAYNSVLMTQNIEKAVVDPATGAVQGEPTPVTTGSILWSSPDPSPDGERLAFYSRVQPEGDLYVARTDGTALRQVTSDEALDRVPRWSPDGEWIAYFSNRSGSLEVWKIRPDGSDQTQLTELNVSLVGWSPDSSRIAVAQMEENTTYLIDTTRSATDQDPRTLPSPNGGLGPFMAPSWSPDGEQLAGQRGFPGTGILTYSFETESYELLTDFGEWPAWLPDSRQIMFVTGGKEFFVVDSRSKEVRQVFSVPRDVIGPPRLSRDGRVAFFTRRVTEADVWLLTLAEN
ncbi:MAG: serine/threonine-protein kinase [Acidobacteria bacterium]|nr:MAG: serine/threonine-protein kinase [Acidobacteriota bacterium]